MPTPHDQTVPTGHSLAEVATFLAVSKQQVDTWRKRYESFPQPQVVDGRNTYDLDAVATWKRDLDASRRRQSARPLQMLEMLDYVRGEFAEPRTPILVALICASGRAQLEWNPHTNCAEILATEPRVADALLSSSQWSKPQIDAVQALIERLRLSEIDEVTSLLLQLDESASRARTTESVTAPALTEVLQTIVKVLSPKLSEVFDPACGAAGSLIAIASTRGAHAYGQDLNQDAVIQAKLRSVLTDVPAEIHFGDSFASDKFAGKHFETVVAVPPFGVRIDAPQDHEWLIAAPAGRADLGWLQHVIAHTADGGLGLCVMLAGALFDHHRRNVEIRNALVRAGAIEAVIQLPSLPLATRIPHCIVVSRPLFSREPNEVLFVDLTQFDVGRRGERLNQLCERIEQILRDFNAKKLSALGESWAVVPVLELLDKDVNLVPQQIVAKRAISLERPTINLGDQRAKIFGLLATLSSLVAARPPITAQLSQVPLGALLEQGRAQLIAGSRVNREALNSNLVQTSVVTVASLRSGKPVGDSTEISADDARQAPRTLPGDIVFTTVGEPAARVDESGGNAVLAPVSILRIDASLSSHFIAAALGSEQAAKLMPPSAVRRMQIHAIPVPLVERDSEIDRAMQDLEAMRQLASSASAELEALLKSIGNVILASDKVAL